MTANHTAVFVILFVAIIAFFPVLDFVRMWRLTKHVRAEQRERMKHARKHWRRSFIWTVFSTKRVPRLTDQSDSRLNRQG
jgi:hypothetical protein